MINLVTALYHFLSLVVPIGKKASLPENAARSALTSLILRASSMNKAHSLASRE